jgi:hypothetical protein
LIFINSGANVGDLLKDGTTYSAGIDEATMKNIEAVQKLSKITGSSMGPNGMWITQVEHAHREPQKIALCSTPPLPLLWSPPLFLQA